MRNGEIRTGVNIATMVMSCLLLTSCGVYPAHIEYYEPHAFGGIATPVATRSSNRAVEGGPNTYPTINSGLDVNFGERRLRVTAENSFMANGAPYPENEAYIRISLALDPSMEIIPSSCVVVINGKELKSTYAKYAPDLHKVGGQVDLAYRPEAWPRNFDLYIHTLTVEGKPVNVPMIQFERQTLWTWGTM